MGVFNGEDMHGLLFQVGAEVITYICIFLDSQSIVNILSNVSLLKNIRYGYRCMNVLSNVGLSCTNLIGDLEGEPELI